MKIGILTQPIHTNYGGILQAFALQTILTRLGFRVYIINRDNRTWLWLFLHRCLRLLYDLLHRDYVCPMNRELILLQSKQREFIDKELHLTKQVNTTHSLRRLCESLGLQGYVVGSDQVWRPKYSPNISNFFLDFVKDDNVKRVAYAASLGTDKWSLSMRETSKCRRLAQKFDGISVREKSAVKLCNSNLGVKAVHVLDPTLLLDAVDYTEFSINEREVEGELFAYFLDDNSQKRSLLHYISDKVQMKSYSCMPILKATTLNMKSSPADCIFPSIGQWIKSFMSAKMVVTDSFHGCAFSIIFNKPFWVCGNKSRGNTRFESLLSMFDLSERYLSYNDISTVNFETPINWEKVNKKRKKLISESISFLQTSIEIHRPI